MWVFTEIANWFEEKRARSDKILDNWVEESNYSQGVILTAATTKALTTFGAGFVDILRLGDGVQQGGIKGVGTDALRFAAIFPVGKAAQILKSMQGVKYAKVVVDTGGPHCFWIASAKAFAQISHSHKGRLLASVDDIAHSLGMNMNSLWAIPRLSAGLAHLRALGAKVGLVRSLRPASAIKDLERMVPFDGSIVMVAVRLIKNNAPTEHHAIYAYRTIFGQIRYMDRTIQHAAQNVFKSINEIVPNYRNTKSMIPYEAAVISNMFAKSVGYEAPRLFMPILGVISTKKE